MNYDNDLSFPYPSLKTIPKYSPSNLYVHNLYSATRFRWKIMDMIERDQYSLFTSSKESVEEWIHTIFKLEASKGDIIKAFYNYMMQDKSHTGTHKLIRTIKCADIFYDFSTT